MCRFICLCVSVSHIKKLNRKSKKKEEANKNKIVNKSKSIMVK